MEELSRSRYKAKNKGVHTGKARSAARNTDLREKVMSQCIVSGIVLIIVLVLCLVDNRITIGVRESIKSALSGETSIEAVSSTINGLTKSYAGAMDSLNTIFGGVNNGGQQVRDGLPDMSEAATENDPLLSPVNSADPANPAEPDQTQEIPDNRSDSTGIVSNSDPAADTLPDSQPKTNQNAADEPITTQSTATSANSRSITDENFRIDEDVLAEINSRVDFYNKR